MIYRGDLFTEIIKLFENYFGQAVKDLAKKLGINRILLAGYLKVLENKGYIKPKRIRTVKVYFQGNVSRL